MGEIIFFLKVFFNILIKNMHLHEFGLRRELRKRRHMYIFLIYFTTFKFNLNLFFEIGFHYIAQAILELIM